jgi:hypothetical protein
MTPLNSAIALSFRQRGTNVFANLERLVGKRAGVNQGSGGSPAGKWFVSVVESGGFDDR